MEGGKTRQGRGKEERGCHMVLVCSKVTWQHFTSAC
jgi:hypothetical protein